MVSKSKLLSVTSSCRPLPSSLPVREERRSERDPHLLSGPRLPRALPERPRSPGWTQKRACGHDTGMEIDSRPPRLRLLPDSSKPVTTKTRSPPESDPSEHRTSGTIPEACRPPSPALSVPQTLPPAGSTKAESLSSRYRAADNGVFLKASAP